MPFYKSSPSMAGVQVSTQGQIMSFQHLDQILMGIVKFSNQECLLFHMKSEVSESLACHCCIWRFYRPWNVSYHLSEHCNKI